MVIPGAYAAGGDGGNGRLQGGDGGKGGSTSGGGIYDVFAGTLDILQCTIALNATAHGPGGSAGSGPGSPQSGPDGSDAGGGISIDPSATAQRSQDTVIDGNSVSTHKNVDSMLGKI
jgi:hypothetical protein